MTEPYMPELGSKLDVLIDLQKRMVGASEASVQNAAQYTFMFGQMSAILEHLKVEFGKLQPLVQELRQEIAGIKELNHKVDNLDAGLSRRVANLEQSMSSFAQEKQSTAQFWRGVKSPYAWAWTAVVAAIGLVAGYVSGIDSYDKTVDHLTPPAERAP